MKRAQGFTLIELIVVIVILGILAATALPKFMDLGGDARKAVVDGLNGSMSSAASMVYAKAAIAGKTAGTTATLTSTEIPALGSGTLNLAYGYPKDGTDLKLVMDLDSAKFDSAATGFNLKGYAVGTCGVGYTAPTAAGLAPTYAVNKGGC